MRTITKLHCLLVFTWLFFACERDDDTMTGQLSSTTVELTGKVLHHERPIPHARVFLKTGAREFPGTDTLAYDQATSASFNADYRFTDLPSGDYYLFGMGYDSLIRDSVIGGIPLRLPKDKSIRKINVPVTE